MDSAAEQSAVPHPSRKRSKSRRRLLQALICQEVSGFCVDVWLSVVYVALRFTAVCVGCPHPAVTVRPKVP